MIDQKTLRWLIHGRCITETNVEYTNNNNSNNIVVKMHFAQQHLWAAVTADIFPHTRIIAHLNFAHTLIFIN